MNNEIIYNMCIIYYRMTDDYHDIRRDFKRLIYGDREKEPPIHPIASYYRIHVMVDAIRLLLGEGRVDKQEYANTLPVARTIAGPVFDYIQQIKQQEEEELKRKIAVKHIITEETNETTLQILYDLFILDNKIRNDMQIIVDFITDPANEKLYNEITGGNEKIKEKIGKIMEIYDPTITEVAVGGAEGDDLGAPGDDDLVAPGDDLVFDDDDDWAATDGDWAATDDDYDFEEDLKKEAKIKEEEAKRLKEEEARLKKEEAEEEERQRQMLIQEDLVFSDVILSDMEKTEHHFLKSDEYIDVLVTLAEVEKLFLNHVEKTHNIDLSIFKNRSYIGSVMAYVIAFIKKYPKPVLFATEVYNDDDDTHMWNAYMVFNYIVRYQIMRYQIMRTSKYKDEWFMLYEVLLHQPITKGTNYYEMSMIIPSEIMYQLDNIEEIWHGYLDQNNFYDRRDDISVTFSSVAHTGAKLDEKETAELFLITELSRKYEYFRDNFNMDFAYNVLLVPLSRFTGECVPSIIESINIETQCTRSTKIPEHQINIFLNKAMCPLYYHPTLVNTALSLLKNIHNDMPKQSAGYATNEIMKRLKNNELGQTEREWILFIKDTIAGATDPTYKGPMYSVSCAHNMTTTYIKQQQVYPAYTGNIDVNGAKREIKKKLIEIQKETRPPKDNKGKDKSSKDSKDKYKGNKDKYKSGKGKSSTYKGQSKSIITMYQSGGDNSKINALRVIFSRPISMQTLKKLKYTVPALTYGTHNKDKAKIMEIIYNKLDIIIPPSDVTEAKWNNMTPEDKLGELTMSDLTASIGSDVSEFAKYTKHVNAVEYDNNTYQLLKHNMELLGYDNVSIFNADSSKWIDTQDDIGEIVFIDPPWGPDYKNKLVRLPLGELSLEKLVDKLLTRHDVQLVVLKVPLSYDVIHLKNELSKYTISVHKLEKMLIITVH